MTRLAYIPFGIMDIGFIRLKALAMPSPKLDRLRISGLRSIGDDPADIRFPAEGSLVILSENNAGKSNIIRSIEMIWGESWPKSFEPQDHEFYDRLRAQLIELKCNVSEMNSPKWHQLVAEVGWYCDESREPNFDACHYSYVLE